MARKLPNIKAYALVTIEQHANDFQKTEVADCGGYIEDIEREVEEMRVCVGNGHWVSWIRAQSSSQYLGDSAHLGQLRGVVGIRSMSRDLTNVTYLFQPGTRFSIYLTRPSC